MADAVVQVIDQRAIVDLSGAALIAPLVADARDYRDRAAASAASAQLAQAAALTVGSMYATAAQGIAAVSSGAYFLIPGDDSYTFAILYRRSGSTAIEIDRYANRTLVDGARRNAANIGAAFVRLRAGQATQIACCGTSLTYGQDTTSGTTQVAINGASQTRSTQTFPDNLREALQIAGFTVTVLNQGYPGDTTVQGLARWSPSAANHLVLLEYGHNDANNFGGTGSVSISDFAANLERLIVSNIVAGSGVMVVLPPNITPGTNQNRLQPFRMVAALLATRYGCPTFDVAECLQSMLSPWTDGIHLQSGAYAEWGWQMAGLFVHQTGAMRKVAEGDVFYATDGLIRGGTLTTDSRARPGVFLTLAAGASALIAADFTDNVRPIVRTYQDTAQTTLTMYYAGGGGGDRGVASAQMVLDPAFPAQMLVGTEIRRGLRFFALRNDGTDPIYIESIEFSATAASMSRGSLVKVDRMTGVFQPRRLSAAQGAFWTYADWSTRLAGPYRLVARVELGAAGGPCGIAVWTGPPFVSGDFVARDGLIVARDGGSLLVYELANQASTTATTVANVFSAGAFMGEIEIELTAASVKVYVDGVLKATRTSVPYRSGYPGLVSGKANSVRCTAMYHDALIKGPY